MFLPHPLAPRRSSPVIPAALLNSTTPKLAGLELHCCNFSWKSALLKGLRTLGIWNLPQISRPPLEDWLDALDEMPELEVLILRDAGPICSTGHANISEPQRTITLPFLTQFEITADVLDCVPALAHLVLPVLTSLRVDTFDRHGNGICPLIPHVVRNAHGLQDMAPLQRIVIQGRKCHVKILAWTIPDADIDDCIQPRMDFRAWGYMCDYETCTTILDALLTHLSTDAISTLSIEYPTRLTKEFLLRHVSSLVMLERVHLDPTSFRAFRDMLTEDPPPISPRLPRLRKLVLRKVSLTALRTYRLRDMLKQRAEQGAPLETLDLRRCTAAHRAIELLATTVGDVQAPEKTLKRGDPAFFHWKGGVELFDEKEKLAEDDEYDSLSGAHSC